MKEQNKEAITIRKKIIILQEIIRDQWDRIKSKKNPGIVIAFSGGIDSTLIADITNKTINPHKNYQPNNIILVNVNSSFISEAESSYAEFAADKIKLDLKKIQIDIMSDKNIKKNDDKRCYYCKKQIIKELKSFAKKKFNNFLIFDGTNYSDYFDNRAGKKAIIEEDIITPLRDAKLTKSEIKRIGKNHLSWHHMKSESCLATRIPSGNKIDPSLLKKIEECEIILKKKKIPYIQFKAIEEDNFSVAMIRILEKNENKISSRILNDIKEVGFNKVYVDIL